MSHEIIRINYFETICHLAEKRDEQALINIIINHDISP